MLKLQVRAARANRQMRLASASFIQGLVLASAIAFVSFEALRLEWVRAHGVSALTIALLLGMVAGSVMRQHVDRNCASGIAFARQRLLRLGIVLYGLRLTVADIGALGLSGVLVDIVMVCSTFAMACWAGKRLFGLDRPTAMLVGVGSAICGAAAVMATEPLLRSRPEQVTAAISTVVVFGTLSTFLYPVFYNLNAHYGFLVLSQQAYGLYVGSTVHEVAQVVAAGQAVGQGAADTAVVAKLVRVILLAPFLLLLSGWLVRERERERRPGGVDLPSSGPESVKGGVVVPWFALGFIALAVVNSTGVLPPAWVAHGIAVDTLVLTLAMAALGLSTDWSAVQRAGFRSIALGLLLFVWLTAGGLLVNTLLNGA